jgi:hypothetical protein
MRKICIKLKIVSRVEFDELSSILEPPTQIQIYSCRGPGVINVQGPLPVTTNLGYKILPCFL